MACGKELLKHVLFSFNFIFWILGIVVVGVGAYSRVSVKDYNDLLGSGGATSAANLLIAAGSLVMFIGFVGCCGAMKESKPLLVIYFILVFLIFVIEISAGGLAYSKMKVTQVSLTDNIIDVVNTNYGNKNATLAEKKIFEQALDLLQKKLQCCGANGASDWLDSTWMTNNNQDGNTTTLLAPASCCKNSNADCQQNSENLFEKGCIEAGKAFVIKHSKDIGIVGICIGIVQLVVLVAVICLIRSIKQERDESSVQFPLSSI